MNGEAWIHTTQKSMYYLKESTFWYVLLEGRMCTRLRMQLDMYNLKESARFGLVRNVGLKSK